MVPGFSKLTAYKIPLVSTAGPSIPDGKPEGLVNWELWYKDDFASWTISPGTIGVSLGCFSLHPATNSSRHITLGLSFIN
jgi:hypothetical protein